MKLFSFMLILILNYNVHICFNAGENKLVQAGRKAMKRGALKPRFLIWDILIKKTDFDKI